MNVQHLNVVDAKQSFELHTLVADEFGDDFDLAYRTARKLVMTQANPPEWARLMYGPRGGWGDTQARRRF